MTDIFAQATVVAKKKPAASKPTKPKMDCGASLDTLAAIDALMSTLATVASNLEHDLKDMARKNFANQFKETGTRVSIEGFSEHARASLEMRRRASSSALKADELALLETHAVPVGENVKQEEHFYFNPTVLKDQNKMKAIAAALQNVPELAGEQLLMKQEVEKTSIVTEDTLKAIGELAKKGLEEEKVVDLLRVVGVLAIKPALTDNSMTKVLKLIGDAGISLNEETK